METTAFLERLSVSSEEKEDVGSLSLVFLSRTFQDGLDVVDAIEEVGSNSGMTSKKVVIKDCGEL